MALLNIFKKGKEKPKEVKKTAPPALAPKPKNISGQAYKTLKKLHITEKATYLTSKNQYVFNVFPDSNKNQIKKAVEDVYGVEVMEVNIINVPQKKRRLGKIEGMRGGYKKAIVKIKEGQKIEMLAR